MRKLSYKQILKNREKWEAALVSGKYKQATHVLHNPETDGYCCLGVAAEVLGVPRVSKVKESVSKEIRDYYGKDDAWSVAPFEVRRALGLVDEVGSKRNASGDSLTERNDSGQTFEQIANLLKTGNYYMTQFDMEDPWYIDNILKVN